ncbi:MAG: NAD(P)/FAD-dependent oxidoreductase [Hyphomicrobiaceae bacterium]
MSDLETVVIGGGVVGLAVARALAETGGEVVVVERNGQIGEEISSRNSEVVHAGIYYPTGSLKARLSVRGRHMLKRFAADAGIPYKELGKIIVATEESQIPAMRALARTAHANGVDDVVEIGASEARRLEPAVRAVGALLSPSTAIVDAKALMLALEGGLTAAGGQVVLHTHVAAIRPLADGGYEVSLGGDQAGERLTCRRLVLAAGLGGPQLAVGLAHAGYTPPDGYLARGNYFSLTGKCPFSRLVYPMPVPGGLGIHATLDMGGQVRFGPDVEWVETLDYTVDPGRARSFYASIRTYWPDLADDTLVPAYAGIRPKITPEGAPAADFAIHGPQEHGLADVVLLLGIESPGLTSSLAIAEEVVRLLGS